MNTFIKRIFTFLLALVGTSIVQCSVAFAEDFIGGGTGGVTVSCGTATTYQLLCGSPAGSAGGGASWHIYSASSYSGPQYIESITLTGGITRENIMSDCPASKNKWYAAYGWDGLNNRLGQHVGPARNGEGTIANAIYNNYGAHSFDEVKRTIQNGGYPDNWRITKAAAEELHGGPIEGWVGYFCISDKLFESEYYAVSNSAAKVDGGEENFVTTGITSTNVSKDADVLNVNVGEKVQIRFSHNVFSNVKLTNDTPWVVTRNFTTGLDGRNGQTKGFTAFNNKYSEELYIADNRPESDGKTAYVLRDVYEKVFDTEGYYGFCESINIGTVTTTACVSVNVGKKCQGDDCECYGINCQVSLCDLWTPESYLDSNEYSGTTSVVSKVRNTSLTNFYKEWQDEVYAKPNDKIAWINCYYPGVQYLADTTVTDENKDPEPDDSSLNFSNTLDNHTFSSYSDWENEYTITSQNLLDPNSFYYHESFSDGMHDVKDKMNNYDVVVGQAGSTLSEKIDSGTPAWAKAKDGADHGEWPCHHHRYYVQCDCDENGENCDTCPVDEWLATCWHTNLFYWNDRGGIATDSSSVKVPYNFVNSSSVSILDDILYAGEKVKISSAIVSVNPRYNVVTQGNYATQVDNAKTKLVGYLSSSSSGSEREWETDNICAALPKKDGLCDVLDYDNDIKLNKNANLSGSRDVLDYSGSSYNIYDAKAGDYFCVVTAVYPYTSGDYRNMDVNGSGSWYISSPSCRIIAKRPSFQVWGGSIYAEKSVNTSVAAKTNLKNVSGYGYDPNKSNIVVYGSWIEQSVVANGSVSGLASGAATGDLAKSPFGGSKENNTNYCDYRVPLSFANYGKASNLVCPNAQMTGNLGVSGVAIDRGALASYWWVADANYTTKTTINLRTDYEVAKSVHGNNIRYTQSSNGIVLTAATIDKGVTQVVQAGGDVRIGGNIIYQNGTYIIQEEIPKLLIYSEGDIVIDCSVDRVDAILIAKGTVNTCDSNNDNAPQNSRQLVINGMVIADKLKLNRTYGAATGVNSGIPAEIINYDASAIIWGNDMADANDFETLRTVYQQEIAPRY